jgi:predicted NBD/HSP70 family sugar kinase
MGPCYTNCMYLGVDVGGTKTLVAVLDEHGVIRQKQRIATPKTYGHFLLELRHIAAHLGDFDFKAGGAGIPAIKMDRKHGRAANYGNLPWRDTPIQADLERIFDCPFVIENDAKMACLSEAMLLKDKYGRVAYATISTGVGYALVNDGVIDVNIGDGGGRILKVEHRGKHIALDDFASGRAIVERYGKKAEDIHDKATWQKISRDIAKGLVPLIAMMEPEVLVIGGSVGVYFDRYANLLMAELKKYELPSIFIPELRQAQRPEEAVIFGCYDLAKQVYGHAKTAR